MMSYDRDVVFLGSHGVEIEKTVYPAEPLNEIYMIYFSTLDALTWCITQLLKIL